MGRLWPDLGPIQMLIFLSEIDNFVLIISFSFIGWICLKSADQVRSNFDVCFWNRFTFLWFLLSTKERGGFIISGGFFFEPNRDCRLPHDSIVKILLFTSWKFSPQKFIFWAFSSSEQFSERDDHFTQLHRPTVLANLANLMDLAILTDFNHLRRDFLCCWPGTTWPCWKVTPTHPPYHRQ